MSSTSSLRRRVGTTLIALAASAAVLPAPASAQSAYGCGRIDTRIELAESAAGPDVYTALPRSRSTSIVARFIAMPKSSGGQDPKPGICVFTLRLTGLKFVTGGSLPAGVKLAAGGATATWTLNFVAGQSPRVNLPVRASSSKTKAAKLSIRGKTSADPITAFETSLKKARAAKASGAIGFDALTGTLRENRRRTFAGTIDVPRCSASDAGKLRLHFTLPNGLRGTYPQAVVLKKSLRTVKGVRVPRCRYSVSIFFTAARGFAGESFAFQVRSSKAGHSKTQRLRVPGG
jgi:hypothetical protein